MTGTTLERDRMPAIVAKFSSQCLSLVSIRNDIGLTLKNEKRYPPERPMTYLGTPGGK